MIPLRDVNPVGSIKPCLTLFPHMHRVGCQPEKNYFHGGQSRPWSAEQGKEKKKESLAAHTHTPAIYIYIYI